MNSVVYGNTIEVPLRRSRNASASRRGTALLGQWLRLLDDSHRPWLEVATRDGSTKGWVQQHEVSDQPALKVFFVDVGQGDGAVIETPQNKIVLIDGGPSRLYYDWLVRRAGPVFAEQRAAGNPEKIHIDAMVVSHPDDDHFNGFTHLLRDDRFAFGTIYHNGIVRYDNDLVDVDSPLGTMRGSNTNGQPRIVTETFSSLDEASMKVESGKLMSRFHDFWEAALAARDEGRLQASQRLTYRDHVLPGFAGDAQQELRIEVLAPITTSAQGPIEYVGFASPEHPNAGVSASHTVNGHSIVLKLLYGQHTFLFSGDLNIPSQQHLLHHYSHANPFAVDVAKVCHHGSSDFDVDFLKKVNPQVNVFSSGDERLHDHPMPDALGAAARHARGDIPLLFSTELARAEFSTRTHYGRINARSNGTLLVMAQFKERGSTADPWHTFEVPFRGRFPAND